jgi:ABC-type uncharacterized transport system permease subunit
MKALFGLVFGLSLSLFLTLLAGESPLHILDVMFKSSFGSWYDLGLTLFYTTTFIFTGLSVCLAFHAGLFNIGAEGQMTVGVLAGTCTALLTNDLPTSISFFLSILMSLLVAGFWGFIPGFLKTFRNSHEVIITMMLNFIAAALASYVVLSFFQNPNSQNPETAQLNQSLLFAPLIQDSPFNISFFIAILLIIFTHLYLYKTTWGFNLRMTGLNEQTARLSAIHSSQLKILGMSLAGAFAGFVFLNEVLGSSGKYRIGFSAEYGFVGIAVAMLARNKPLYILPTAFLFGFLQKGSSELDLETQYITRDFAKVLQAIIIFSVIGFESVHVRTFFEKLIKKTRLKKNGNL